jgi:hypothetical protein
MNFHLFLVIFVVIEHNIAKHQHVFVFAFEKDLNLSSLDVRVEDDENSAWKNVFDEKAKNDEN